MINSKKIIAIKKWLAILLLLQCMFSFAQQNNQYTFRHINQPDGLLHTRVWSIVQDGKGYIWILTPNGLQRYDGSRFVTYPYDLNNPGWLTDTREADLFVDKKKNYLWITNLEIQQLDVQKNKFSLYDEEKLLKDNNFKFDAYSDSAGNQWLCGDFGIYYPFGDTSKLSRLIFSAPFLTPNKSHIYIRENQIGETWLASSYGLYLFDKATSKIYTHEYNPLNNELLKVMDKKKLGNILKDSQHNIWLSSLSDSFYRYNSNTKKLSVYFLSDNTGHNLNQEGIAKVKCFFEDNHHTIWIGTDNAGLLRYNSDKDNFTSILNDEKNKQGLHYNYSISSIFQDREENIWLGTDKGINIFNPYRQYFQSIHHEENNASSLPNNEILNFIQADNGDIIACTWGGGLTVYDDKWNFKKNIYFPGPYEYNLVWSLAQNDDGTIWAGCQHGYIHIYNPLNGAIETIHPPEVKNNTIWSMAKDKKGNIWMGLHNGKITGWNKKENKFYAYNDSLKGIAQTYMPALTIFFDSKQRCWVSTEVGLKQFDTGKRFFSAVYTRDKDNTKSISSNYCSGIEEYDDSTLLIGTRYGGLNFFNPDNNTFTRFSITEGLPSNSIHAIKKDDAGYIWFTTDYEMYKFRMADKKFIRLNIQVGSTNAEFNNTSFYTLRDGRWLTATATEMIYFSPKNFITEKKSGTKVEITNFKIFDNILSVDSLIDVNKPVRLSYQQNFITIEFAVLNFSNLQQANYYYRLDWVDKDWVNAGIKNFANYTNLAPGEYTFSVKADNGNSITGETTFVIIITPPFWKTWWFKTLLLLLAIGIIYGLLRKRIKVIRHEAELKQKIAETEMMALRTQMNPHFIFNCLNSIDNLIQNEEKEKATLYLSKFAKLIRSILEASKNNVVPCWKDIETLKLYLELEELRWDKKISYTINIADEIQNGDYKVPPLVIQPFVENAIHHGLLNKTGSDRKLAIDIAVSQNHIHYTIMDNGVGRAKAASYKKLNTPTHESMGMQITTDRINLFNQNNKVPVKITDLYDDEQQPAGTKVEVELINQ